MSLEVPYFRQHRYYTCGPACLRMVLAYYGYETDEVSLTMLCGVTVFGVEPSKLAEGGARLGFNSEFKNHGDFDYLAEQLRQGRPVIVAVDAGVLYDGPTEVAH